MMPRLPENTPLPLSPTGAAAVSTRVAPALTRVPLLRPPLSHVLPVLIQCRRMPLFVRQPITKWDKGKDIWTLGADCGLLVMFEQIYKSLLTTGKDKPEQDFNRNRLITKLLTYKLLHHLAAEAGQATEVFVFGRALRDTLPEHLHQASSYISSIAFIVFPFRNAWYVIDAGQITPMQLNNIPFHNSQNALAIRKLNPETHEARHMICMPEVDIACVKVLFPFVPPLLPGVSDLAQLAPELAADHFSPHPQAARRRAEAELARLGAVIGQACISARMAVESLLRGISMVSREPTKYLAELKAHLEMMSLGTVTALEETNPTPLARSPRRF